MRIFISESEDGMSELLYDLDTKEFVCIDHRPANSLYESKFSLNDVLDKLDRIIKSLEN